MPVERSFWIFVIWIHAIIGPSSMLPAHARVEVYESVAAMKQGQFEAGTVLSALGYYAPADGGAATYVVQQASSQADGLMNHELGNDLVAVLKLGGPCNPLVFGAKGDGVANDTAAFNAMEAYLQALEGPAHVHIPNRVFIVNPLDTSKRRYLLGLHTDGSKLTCAGWIKIQQGPDYTAGRKKGTEWYWSAVEIRANHCTVDGLNFSGNGTGSYHGHKPDVVNLRWSGVMSFGTQREGGYRVGNRAINCTIVQGGGQAMCWQWQKQALIANNYYEDSSGAGFSRCDNSVLTGNIAVRSHDAPFVANGKCDGIVIANNLSKGTTNGSGIDIVGVFNAVVEGNVIVESAAWGLLVSYSAQQKVPSRNILVKSNVFVRNGRSVSAPLNAEICVGSPWDSGSKQINATDITVSGNRFEIDGTHGEWKGRFLALAHGTQRIQILDNVVTGEPNRNKQVLVINHVAKDIVITGNRWVGKKRGVVKIDTPGRVVGSSTIENNAGMALSAGK